MIVYRTIKKKISPEDWNDYAVGSVEIKSKEYVRIYSKHKFEELNEWDYEPAKHEMNCCSFFGCGRTLSLRESLFGNRCIHHQ